MDQIQSKLFLRNKNPLTYMKLLFSIFINLLDLLFALVESTSDKNDEVKQRAKQSILSIARKKKHQNVLDVIYEFLSKLEKKPNNVRLEMPFCLYYVILK
jgi:hypothetical protein